MPKMNDGSHKQESVLLPEDTYTLVFDPANVAEYTRDYGEGPVSRLAWVFTVQGGDYDGVEVAAFTGTSTADNSAYVRVKLNKMAPEGWTGGYTDDFSPQIVEADVEPISADKSAVTKIRKVVEVLDGGQADDSSLPF